MHPRRTKIVIGTSKGPKSGTPGILDGLEISGVSFDMVIIIFLLGTFSLIVSFVFQ